MAWKGLSLGMTGCGLAGWGVGCRLARRDGEWLGQSQRPGWEWFVPWRGVVRRGLVWLVARQSSCLLRTLR